MFCATFDTRSVVDRKEIKVKRGEPDHVEKVRSDRIERSVPDAN
jgi:hypothetical protein